MQEKQSNVIVIIQVPLKQKPKPNFMPQNNLSFGGFKYHSSSLGFAPANAQNNNCYQQSQNSFSFNKNNNNNAMLRKKSHANAVSNVEAAIVKGLCVCVFFFCDINL